VLSRAVLVVLAGLPGTGKTTLSAAVARGSGGVHLRVDAIEHAMHQAGIAPAAVGAAGYAVAQAVAEANLRLGHVVIADAVNAVEVARAAWRAVAARAGAALLEVELECPVQDEHRRRVARREADLPGFVLPGWEAVQARHYEPWQGERLRLDTAALAPSAAAAIVLVAVAARRGGEPPG